LSYYESRLPVDFEDISSITKKLQICEDLRIENVILESKKDLNKIPVEIKKKLQEQSKLNLSYRLNLKPNNLNDFKRRIKQFNKFSDILSIESMNKDVQIHAARDSRVDILSFSNQTILKTLTPGVISLIKQNKSFLEFSLASIMIENKALQSKNFRNLFRFIQLSLKKKVNIIISGYFDKPYNLRHPRSLISICHTLLEIPIIEAKKAFSENPRLLFERVKKRLDNNQIESGVRLIKGGVNDG